MIEYEDCTYSEELEQARAYCKEHNAKLVELVDKREEKTIIEEYEEEYTEEIKIPAVTHEETDEDGNTFTMVDEEERVKYETKTRPAIREVTKLFRYFEIQEA